MEDDKKCLGAPGVPYTATKTGDCNDNDPDIKPTAQEICNKKDDDCDGSIDEEEAFGCQVYYYDNDWDGWGVRRTGNVFVPQAINILQVRGVIVMIQTLL